jgi:hypothetical protein
MPYIQLVILYLAQNYNKLRGGEPLWSVDQYPQKCPLLYPNLEQVHPVHFHKPCLFTISFNIILHFMPRRPH